MFDWRQRFPVLQNADIYREKRRRWWQCIAWHGGRSLGAGVDTRPGVEWVDRRWLVSPAGTDVYY